MSGQRLKANPIEVVVFALITGLFGNTLYTLVHESPNYQALALVPSTVNPTSEGRALASVPTSLILEADVGCDTEAKPPVIDTRASRIRFNGSLCASEEDDGKPAGSSALKSIAFVNTSNRAQGSVFSDATRERFTTEYVPLQAGANTFEVQFTYADGSNQTVTRVVTRN